MPTVVVDAGHGGHDFGATRGNRQEKNDTLRFALALGQVLTNCGVRVIQTRTTDVFVPLEERARISNMANADLFISIHRNAHDNPLANGFENWIYTNPSDASVAAAWLVHNRVVNAGVSADRGIRRGNFAVLRLTRAPAMLYEYGFISNEGDNRLFDNNFNQYVLATANGILSFFGIACPGVTSPGTLPPVTPTPPPQPPQPPQPPTPPTTPGLGPDRLAGTVRTSGGSLNFRNGPSTQSPIIGTIPNGANLVITGELDGFYHVVYGGRTGWVSSAFVHPTPRNGVVTTAGGALNLRSGPSTASPVIGSLPNGTTVRVEDITGGFYRVVAPNGQVGYVSRDFVRLV